MPEHKNLPEAQLHELKGASTASNNTVPVANGSGSTVFKLIPASSIDTASVKNVNIQTLIFPILTPTVAFDFYLPIEFAKRLERVDSVISGTVAGATLNIEILRNSTVLGTLSYPVAGTIAGTRQNLINLAQTFQTTDVLRIRATPTGVTSAGSVSIVFTFTLI